MKAKIKETGEIIDVEHVCNPDDPSDYAFYTFDENGLPVQYYSPMELDFGSCGHSKEIDWEQRRYEIAKAAMQGMMANIPDDSFCHVQAKECIEIADELIKELKGE